MKVGGWLLAWHWYSPLSYRVTLTTLSSQSWQHKTGPNSWLGEIKRNTHIVLGLLGDQESWVVDVNKVSNWQNLKRVFFPEASWPGHLAEISMNWSRRDQNFPLSELYRELYKGETLPFRSKEFCWACRRELLQILGEPRSECCSDWGTSLSPGPISDCPARLTRPFSLATFLTIF